MALSAVPVFPQPLDVPAGSYEEALRSHSNASHAYVTKLLKGMKMREFIHEELSWIPEVGDEADVEILATGSDGRGEKATFVPGRLNGNGKSFSQEVENTEIPSKMDVQAVISLHATAEKLVLRHGADARTVEEICHETIEHRREVILLMMKTDLVPLGIFEDEMEVKSAHDTLPSGFQGDASRPWPTRVIDAVSLTPSPARLEGVLRFQFLQEMQSVERSRKLRDTEKDRIKMYRKVCEGCTDPTGATLKPGSQFYSQTQGVKRNFDLDEGTAYYDRPHGIASFKFGPLRLVQMHTSHLILNLLRSDAGTSFEDRSTIVRELPHNTGEKLRYLSQQHAVDLPQPTLERLVENYNFFLRLYHQSEWLRAAHNQEAFSYAPDAGGRQEVRERLADTVHDAGKLKSSKGGN